MSLYTSPKGSDHLASTTNWNKLRIALLTVHVDRIRARVLTESMVRSASAQISSLTRSTSWFVSSGHMGSERTRAVDFLSDRQRMDRSATDCKYSGDACRGIFCRAKEHQLFR